MQPVPNHPYAHYETGYDRQGRFWIKCFCARCKTSYQKECSRPPLANQHVLRFAQLHAHGLRPVVTR